jgi:hypothetical protein
MEFCLSLLLTIEIPEKISANQELMKMVFLHAKDPSLPMKCDDSYKGKNRSFMNRFICPKTEKLPDGKYVCSCKDKCTTSDCSRMFYTYPKNNYRVHTPIHKDLKQKQWNQIAGFKHIIEQLKHLPHLPKYLGLIVMPVFSVFNVHQ